MKEGISIGILAVRLTKGFGVDVVVDMQATALTKLGYKVTVHLVDYNADFFPNRKYSIKILPPEQYEIIKSVLEAMHEVVIAYTSPFFEVLPKLTKFCHTIAFECGDPTPSLFPSKERQQREKIKIFKQKNVYPFVDNVMVISKFIAEDIGFPDSEVIYCGADHLLSKYERKNISVLNNFPFDKQKLKFLCVCRIYTKEANYKGLDLYEEFMHLVGKDKAEFIILGHGSTEDRDVFVEKGFTVVLSPSNEELLSVYDEVDIFVTFSKWEGCNLPLVESQIMAKPALAMDHACHSEVCPFVFKTVNEMADFCENMNSKKLQNIAKKNVEFVEKFTWDNNAKHLSEFISNNVESNNSLKKSMPDRVTFFVKIRIALSLHPRTLIKLLLERTLNVIFSK